MLVEYWRLKPEIHLRISAIQSGVLSFAFLSLLHMPECASSEY